MNHYLSFTIQSWQDKGDGSMRWKVCRIQDEIEIHLSNALFVARVWLDDEAQMVCGLIHHIQRGSEMPFQSGKWAVDFCRALMENKPILERSESPSPNGRKPRGR